MTSEKNNNIFDVTNMSWLVLDKDFKEKGCSSRSKVILKEKN